MADLKFTEKALFEKLFDRGGYVLDLSNRTFEEFFKDFQINIYDSRFAFNGDSKMKRLRAFLEIESKEKVGEVLFNLLQYAETVEEINEIDKANALRFINRLNSKIGKTNVDNTEITEDDFLQKEFDTINVSQLDLESGLISVLEQRIKEIQKGIKHGNSLSVVFLCGSTLEGILLGTASKNPKNFNTSSSSPKYKDTSKVKPFNEWSLSDFINVSYDVGVIGLDVKKFSHALRDFRNYIHPYEQWTSNFNPSTHTAGICWQVLKAALYDLTNNKNQ